MRIVSSQIPMNGRCGTEINVWTQIIFAVFAIVTVTAWNTRFNSNTIANFEMFYRLADLVYNARWLVANDHWFVYNEITDTTVHQVMNIGPTNAHRIDAQQHLIVFDGWNWTLFLVERNGKRLKF